MKTNFNTFITESDEYPLRSHDLRMEKGYRPKYRSGLIAVRFKSKERRHGAKYQDVDDSGEYMVDYQDLFSQKGNYDSGGLVKSDFVKFFEDKYDVKLSDYRSGTDDYYFYFKCKPGEEKQKMEEIAKDKIVEVVDYVDVRQIEGVPELEDIADKLRDIIDEFGEQSTEKTSKKIKGIIKRLQDLI